MRRALEEAAPRVEDKVVVEDYPHSLRARGPQTWRRALEAAGPQTRRALEGTRLPTRRALEKAALGMEDTGVVEAYPQEAAPRGTERT